MQIALSILIRGKYRKMINTILKEKLAKPGILCGTHTGLNNAVLTIYGLIPNTPLSIMQNFCRW